MRIHSLPESKRYPENEAEYKIILERHNAIADYIFRKGENIIIFKSLYHSGESSTEKAPEIVGIELANGHIVLAQDLDEFPREDDDLFSVWYTQVMWKPDFFDVLVKEVADEKEDMISFVSVESKNVYCPYDGGADIFVFNKKTEEMKLKFRDWISKRADGL